MLSDENGLFSLNIPQEGRFLVGLSSIGYKSFFTKPIVWTPQYKNENLGILSLFNSG
jgi:hypothetical protein